MMIAACSGRVKVSPYQTRPLNPVIPMMPKIAAGKNRPS